MLENLNRPYQLKGGDYYTWIKPTVLFGGSIEYIPVPKTGTAFHGHKHISPCSIGGNVIVYFDGKSQWLFVLGSIIQQITLVRMNSHIEYGVSELSGLCTKYGIENWFDDTFNIRHYRNSDTHQPTLVWKNQFQSGCMYKQKDLIHRDGKPAQIYCYNETGITTICMAYWTRNKLNRVDGPAIVRSDGLCIWYNNGVKIKTENTQSFNHELYTMLSELETYLETLPPSLSRYDLHSRLGIEIYTPFSIESPVKLVTEDSESKINTLQSKLEMLQTRFNIMSEKLDAIDKHYQLEIQKRDQVIKDKQSLISSLEFMMEG